MNDTDRIEPLVVENVDIHVVNSCNLRCFGCNHLADYGYGGPFPVAEVVDWIQPWKNRLRFKRINLMGGEPLLHPELKDICMEYRSLFAPEETKIRIITNGIRITRSPWLKELIQDHRVHIQVSLHVLTGRENDPRLVRQVRQGLALLERWAADEDVNVTTNWAPYVDSKEKLNFQVFYQGSGSDIKPFQHNDPAKSKEHCTCKTLQLYKSRLYKCAPIAYIGEVLKKVGKAADPHWQPYLRYSPLAPDCNDEQLRQFMARQPQPEWTCGMCPAFENLIPSEKRAIY